MGRSRNRSNRTGAGRKPAASMTRPTASTTKPTASVTKLTASKLPDASQSEAEKQAVVREEAANANVRADHPKAEQSGKTVDSQPVIPKADSEVTLREERRRKMHRRHMRALRSLIFRTLSLALVIYILFFHLVGIVTMPNGDMYPRIDSGDLVLYYRLEHNIRAQDVIVFEKPTASLEQSYEGEEVTGTGKMEKAWWRKALDWIGFKDPAEPPKTLFVCRVVAGPGDKVEISEGERLMVNGNAMIETNIFYNTPNYVGFVEYPLTLGEGQYFVLADYRNGGADSRFFGAVNEEDILGTVITIARRNNL